MGDGGERAATVTANEPGRSGKMSAGPVGSMLAPGRVEVRCGSFASVEQCPRYAGFTPDSGRIAGIAANDVKVPQVSFFYEVDVFQFASQI